MIKSDRNFDDITERFARNIYGSAKGEIRLAVVWEHLLKTLPQLEAGRPLRILDAGCGLGHMGLKLHGQGHRLVLSDLSANMIGATKKLFDEEAPGADVQFVHAPVQKLSPEEEGQFDLVLFHAVLEWVAEPREMLNHLLKLIKPGGHLSLMFYNRDALVYRNLIRGNWRKAESNSLQGEEGGLTPYYPLSLDEVEAWLQAANAKVLGRVGVRVVHDYMDRHLRENRDMAEMIRIEQKYAGHPAYIRLGRYIHIAAEIL